MKLFVCYGTFGMGPHEHPCREAHKALDEAGHEHEVVNCYGLGVLPDAFNFTKGRREVRKLTGKNYVPVLVTDDGEVIRPTAKIIEWARNNPAEARTSGGASGAGA